MAKKPVGKFGWVRVDLDEINTERGIGGKSNDEISDEDWRITYNESYKRVDEALRDGKIVINDTANFTREQRDKLRVIAAKYDLSTRVVYFNIPNLVARERWQKNRTTNARYDVTDADFAEVADNFEPPTEDENVIIYDGVTPVGKWVNTVIWS